MRSSRQRNKLGGAENNVCSTPHEEEDNTRFTSRNIKKTHPSVYSRVPNRVLKKTYPYGHSEKVIEVLDIAAKSKVKIRGTRALRFIEEFYLYPDSKITYLRNAPKHVQRQYLNSFQDFDNHKDLEIFMKVAELTNYSSFLLNRKSEERNLLKIDQNYCFLSSLSASCNHHPSELIKKFSDADSIHRQLIFVSSLRSGTAGIRKINDRVGFKDDVDMFVKSFNSAMDNRVVISTIFMLVDGFSIPKVEEVIEEFYKVERPLNLGEIVELTSRWSEVKDYPIEWTLDSI